MLPTASITRLPSGGHKLAIQGEFTHPHWLVFLFQGLADRDISVASGWARSGEGNQWEGEIVLDFRKSAAAPEALNYVDLALKKRPAPTGDLPRLSRFSINRTSDQALEAHLEGPDQVGFLARVLGKLGGLMLFPTEIAIATLSGRIQDRFVLRDLMGGPPAESARQSLESLLASLVTA